VIENKRFFPLSLLRRTWLKKITDDIDVIPVERFLSPLLIHKSTKEENLYFVNNFVKTLT